MVKTKHQLNDAQRKLFDAIEAKLRFEFEKTEATKIANSNEEYLAALSILDSHDENLTAARNLVTNQEKVVNKFEERLGIRAQKCYDGNTRGKRIFVAPYHKEFTPKSVLETLTKIEQLRLIGKISEAKKLKYELIQKYKLDAL